jgi:uncharacterized protein (TIGR00266 family)
VPSNTRSGRSIVAEESAVRGADATDCARARVPLASAAATASVHANLDGVTRALASSSRLDVEPRASEIWERDAPTARLNSRTRRTTMARTSDEIDYELIGDDLQAVIVTLDPGETVIAEAGAMMFMEQGIEMNTTLDPNKQGSGLMGKLFQGAKRVLSGDTFFITTFLNNGSGRKRVAFSSHFPGKIKPIDLQEWGGTIIAQKDSFLCAPKGTNVDIAFTKKIGAGFFGGEGFILQKITGDGVAVLHASGAIFETTLMPSETLRVDTGCIVAMEQRVRYDIKMVPGIKTALFGGEGLFFATLTGPGRVLLQTMPFSRLADRIIASAPRAGGSRVQEGSVLGGIGGALLGGVLGGDE